MNTTPLQFKYFSFNDISTPLHNVFTHKNELSTLLALDGGSNSFNNNNSSSAHNVSTELLFNEQQNRHNSNNNNSNGFTNTT